METLMSGGVLMIPLGICALLGLAFIFERFVVLGKVPDDDTAQSEFEAAERILLNEGEVAAAQHCNAGEGPLNFVFAYSSVRTVSPPCFVRRGRILTR